MILHHLKIFFGIERGAAFDPGMDRVGSNDVEFIARGQNEVARVIVNDCGARIASDVIVLNVEIFCSGGRNERLHFADYNFLNTGIGDEGSGSDARAESDDQNGLRIGMDESSEMAERALQ